MPQTHLIIFVKAPRPGFVKTRLASEIGEPEACAAYVQMVEALVRKLWKLPCPVELRYSPDNAAPEIALWRKADWECHPQGEGFLGTRLEAAFSHAFQRGAERVCIIGSDCPYLDTEDINSAFVALHDHDLVLGPAEDGGYWLIGLREPHCELLREIEWSSAQVLRQTLQKARSLRLGLKLLRSLPDIDTQADWISYLGSRAGAKRPQ